MDETELRALIRDAVARHLGSAPAAPASPRVPARPGTASVGHPSQALYLTLSTGSDACLIEPAVGCTHCGYCKTHGY